MSVGKKRIDPADRAILVVIPQWKVLSTEERGWFLRHPLMGLREADKAAAVTRQKVEREVIAYGRVKRDQRFWIGAEPVTMPEGIVLEVLQPDQRDQQDLERQVKLDGKRLVVVRWKGRARLLSAGDVERAEGPEFKAYWRQHGDPEDGRPSGAQGSRSAGA